MASESDYKHCDSLKARVAFRFKPGGKGRAITVKEGDSFWVTSCSTSRERTAGLVCIARKSESMHYRYAFAPDMLIQCFNKESAQ